MSIASEITRLQGVKADILQAISDKGVTVPAGSALDDCPDLISTISGGGVHQDFVNKTILGDTYRCVEISSGVFFPIENLHYKDANIEYITNASDIDKDQSQCFYYNCDEGTYKNNGYLYTYPAIQHVNSLVTGNIKMISSTYVQLIYAYIRRLLEESQSIIPGSCVSDKGCTYLSKDVNVGWSNAYGKINLGFSPTGYYDNAFAGINAYMGFGSMDNHFCDIQNDTWEFRSVNGTGWSTQYCYSSRLIVDEN